MIKQARKIGLLMVIGLSVMALYRGVMSDSIESIGTLEVSSDSFADGQRLPIDFTCEGKNISPHIAWGGVPAGVKSFALICDDPDAPSKNFVHWVIYDMPADLFELAVGIPTAQILENGARQGVNGFGRIGYGGACPPRGHGVHRYFFTVYALDRLLGLQPGVRRAELDAAMCGHIVAKGCIIGCYSRS